MRNHKLLIGLIIFVVIDVVISLYIYFQPGKQNNPTNSLSNTATTKNTIPNKSTVDVVSDIKTVKVASINQENLKTMLDLRSYFAPSRIAAAANNQNPSYVSVTKLIIHITDQLQPYGKAYAGGSATAAQKTNPLTSYGESYDPRNGTLDLYVYYDPTKIANVDANTLTNDYWQSTRIAILLQTMINQPGTTENETPASFMKQTETKEGFTLLKT